MNGRKPKYLRSSLLYKFIFTLLTDPLGLPIHPFWEYVILFVLNEIAFKIAWNASPGGAFGSEIHWAVRIPAFIVLWAITYGIIWAVKWIIVNWMLVLCILGAAILAGVVTVAIKRLQKLRIKKEDG